MEPLEQYIIPNQTEKRKSAMKLLYPAALAMAAFAVLFPIAVVRPPAELPPAAPEISAEPAPTAAPAQYAPLDAARTVMLVHEGSADELTMDKYLEGVLAAEMPASFEPAALEAQCVAARTYAEYKVASGAHGGGLCADPACCEAYCTEEELRARWGEEYEANIAKIRAAVAATDSLILTSGGEPILAAFHSSSSGRTEDCSAVWGRELTYLVSVETPESAGTVPNFREEKTLTAAEFRNTVLAALPGTLFVSGPEGWLCEAERTPSGRLASVRVGSARVTGTELRRIFSLRSTCVTWSVSEEGVTFVTEGYGHGVGMSQYGANELAKEGFACAEILAHYYPGAELSKSVENGGVPM
jgi:stage II sporulation protein D